MKSVQKPATEILEQGVSSTEGPHQAQEHVEDSKVRRKWCVENF